MNGIEAARLAAALNIVRPEWPTQSVQTWLEANLASRPYPDALRACMYVAADPESKTLARVAKPGPWWKFGTEDRVAENAKMHVVCGTFHKPGEKCPGPIIVASGSANDRCNALRSALGVPTKPPVAS